MNVDEVRILWMFVFFDLPVGTKGERRAATRFRNFLKDEGYMMLQWSVYARVCRGEEARPTRHEESADERQRARVASNGQAVWADAVAAGRGDEKREGRASPNGSTLIPAPVRGPESKYFQWVPKKRAYLMGVGRETTAWIAARSARRAAYLMGVGRETTAPTEIRLTQGRAYLMGVGRETTAKSSTGPWAPAAYLMGVGRETTARRIYGVRIARAYLMGVGRETTAENGEEFEGEIAYLMGVGRETTAPRIAGRDVIIAYLMGVGRETTAPRTTLRATSGAYLMGVGRETTALPAPAARSD